MAVTATTGIRAIAQGYEQAKAAVEGLELRKQYVNAKGVLKGFIQGRCLEQPVFGWIERTRSHKVVQIAYKYGEVPRDSCEDVSVDEAKFDDAVNQLERIYRAYRKEPDVEAARQSRQRLQFEIFQRVLLGHSLETIYKDLNDVNKSTLAKVKNWHEKFLQMEPLDLDDEDLKLRSAIFALPRNEGEDDLCGT